jgi:hypothetical protein
MKDADDAEDSSSRSLFYPTVATQSGNAVHANAVHSRRLTVKDLQARLH